jgi:hypothetical protein
MQPNGADAANDRERPRPARRVYPAHRRRRHGRRLYGAGKIKLVQGIAERLQAAVIDVDRYVDPGRDAFVEALRGPELKAAVDAALVRSDMVFLSGVCARDVADRAGLDPALFVYIKRKTLAGVIADMDILDAEDGVQHEYWPGPGRGDRRLPSAPAALLKCPYRLCPRRRRAGRHSVPVSPGCADRARIGPPDHETSAAQLGDDLEQSRIGWNR